MKKIMTLAFVGLLAVSMVGCGSSGNSKSKSTVTVGANELTGTFSPIYYSSSYDGYAVDLVYNKLMDYDINNQLQPSLATKADVSPDGKSVTFHLRKDVKFSDGKPFTAKDVEFTFKAVSDPSYDGRYAGATKYLEGYDTYNKKGNTTEPAFPGIKVIDDYTIKFTTATARNDSLTSFATSFAILSYDQFKDSYKYGNTKPIKDAMSKPIGTGPYALQKWEAGTGASFKKNKDYWGDGFKIENVVIKPTKMTTEFEELKSGNIDILPQSIEPKKIGPASQNEKLKLNHYPRGGAGYITYNAGNGATSDKAVRQALTYAFDRQSFVNSFYECKDCKNLDGVKIGYVPTTQQNPLSPMGDIVTGAKKVEGLETYPYNMDKAKKILDDAGWKVGSDGKRSKDGKKLEIKILSMPDHDILANLVPMWKKEWGEQLGADVKVATVDFNTILDKISSDKNADEWSVFFLGTSYVTNGMTDIATTFDSSYAKDGNDNYSRLKDPTLDGLLDKALTNMDAKTQTQSWIDVAKRVNDDAAVIPIYGNEYFDIYNKRITNLKTGPLYPWTKALKDATIE